MLLDNKDVLAMVRCPQTGVRLKPVGDKLVGQTSERNLSYDIIAGYPVLIDFDTSILNREDIKTLASVVQRRKYGGPLGAVKRLVSPPKKATAANVAELLKRLLADRPKARVLIIGGGTVGQGMQPFYEDPRVELVSFDIYGSANVQFLADAHQLPLADQSFDAVIIQAVLEHVLDPAAVVAEIFRVLKPGAMVYAETPFLQHVHEGAFDFTRFTESGHRYLFRDFGLIRSGASAGAGTQLVWSLDNFFRGLFRSRKVGKALKLGFFWLQYLDDWIPANYNVDAASGVFFLGIREDESGVDLDIVDHYQGAQR